MNKAQQSKRECHTAKMALSIALGYLIIIAASLMQVLYKLYCVFFVGCQLPILSMVAQHPYGAQYNAHNRGQVLKYRPK